MILDTGATTTIIPPQVALDLGCDPSQSKQNVPILTASGLIYLPVVTIPEIHCAGARVACLAIVCHELPGQSTLQGLLGLDFLRQVPLFQEFEKKILALTHT